MKTSFIKKKKIFGTCRIPKEGVDGLEYNPESKHIVIVRNNNFFKLEVENVNGEVPSLNQLIDQLELILNESEVIGPPIGILSTDNRDNWSASFQQLIKDNQNRQSVEEIQKALFLVALDNPMSKLNDSRRAMASK